MKMARFEVMEGSSAARRLVGRVAVAGLLSAAPVLLLQSNAFASSDLGTGLGSDLSSTILAIPVPGLVPLPLGTENGPITQSNVGLVFGSNESATSVLGQSLANGTVSAYIRSWSHQPSDGDAVVISALEFKYAADEASFVNGMSSWLGNQASQAGNARLPSLAFPGASGAELHTASSGIPLSEYFVSFAKGNTAFLEVIATASGDLTSATAISVANQQFASRSGYSGERLDNELASVARRPRRRSGALRGHFCHRSKEEVSGGLARSPAPRRQRCSGRRSSRSLRTLGVLSPARRARLQRGATEGERRAMAMTKRARSRRLRQSEQLLGAGTNAQAYGIGVIGPDPRRTDALLVVVFAAAIALSFVFLGVIIIPGVLLVVVIHGAIDRPASVAVTSRGVAILARSELNGRPRKVLTVLPHGVLTDGTVRRTGILRSPGGSPSLVPQEGVRAAPRCPRYRIGAEPLVLARACRSGGGSPRRPGSGVCDAQRCRSDCSISGSVGGSVSGAGAGRRGRVSSGAIGERE